MQCVKEPVNRWEGGRLSGRAFVPGGICPGGGHLSKRRFFGGHLSRGAFVRTPLLALSIKHVLAVLVVLLKMSHTLRQSGDGD